MSSMLCHVVLFILKIKQGSMTAFGTDDYITSTAAISAIRPTAGDELLPSETYATTAAIARLHIDFCFVNEFHKKDI
jgi:hypothetical protein